MKFKIVEGFDPAELEKRNIPIKIFQDDGWVLHGYLTDIEGDKGHVIIDDKMNELGQTKKVYSWEADQWVSLKHIERDIFIK